MFYFERFLAALLTPLPLIILLLLLGLIFWLVTKKKLLGQILVVSGVLILIVFTTTGLSKYMIKTLEDRYKPYNTLYSQLRSDVNNSGKPLKWVVVLAGGIVNDENLPLSSQLSTPTLTRLIEGIVLQRKFHDSKLILSGGGPKGGTVCEAELMREMALELGVDDIDIVTESKSYETAQQAMEIKKIVEFDNFVLVSSATHLPRAEAMFINLEMKPFVMPTDFLIKNAGSSSSGISFPLPNQRGLMLAERAFYEIWAKLGAAIKGQS